MSSWIVLPEHHWLHIYLGECHRWMLNSPTVHSHTMCSRWGWPLKNSIHSSASRRQRDISGWPQGGHFNNGAWEEAQERTDGKKGLRISGLQRTIIWSVWEILRSTAEHRKGPVQKTTLQAFHHLVQHVWWNIQKEAAASETLRSNFTHLRRRQERVIGSVLSQFAFKKKKK